MVGKSRNGVHLGLDLGGTKCAGILLDRNWNRLVFHEAPVRREWLPREYRAMIDSLVADLLGRARVPLASVRTVGIGVPGVVDEKGNVLKVPNAPSLERMRFDSVAPRARVTVWNDAACAAYGEALAGALAKSAQGVHLTLGTGVGGALVTRTGSKYLLGASWMIEVANIEIGHVMANIRAAAGEGEPYELEEFCSRRFFKRVTDKTIPELFHAWKARDAKMRKLFEQYGVNVGALLATAETLFRPDTIALSGGLLAAFPAFREPMMRTYRARRFLPGPPTRIECSAFGAEIGAFGAALYGSAGERKLLKRFRAR